MGLSENCSRNTMPFLIGHLRMTGLLFEVDFKDRRTHRLSPRFRVSRLPFSLVSDAGEAPENGVRRVRFRGAEGHVCVPDFDHRTALKRLDSTANPGPNFPSDHAAINPVQALFGGPVGARVRTAAGTQNPLPAVTDLVRLTTPTPTGSGSRKRGQSRPRK